MEPLCCHHLNVFARVPLPGLLSRSVAPCGVFGNRTTEARKTLSETLSSTTRKAGLFRAAGFPPRCFFYRNVRAISTARLNVSPRLHLRPIDVVVCDGPWRDLILESASCLDAFSTYPVQTLLPGGAPRRDNRYTGGLSSTVLSY